MARQSHANIVKVRPLPVTGNRGHHCGGQFFLREHLEHLRLRRQRLIEREAHDWRVPSAYQPTSYSRRAAASQGQPLSQRQLWQPPQDQLFGQSPQLRRNRREQAELHQIHQEKLARQAHGHQPRRVWMKCHSTLDRVVGQPLSAPRNALENRLRQILALEEQAEVGLVQMRIFEQGRKDLLARVAEQRWDRAARGGPRVLGIELSLPCQAQECCVSHWPGGTLRDGWPAQQPRWWGRHEADQSWPRERSARETARGASQATRYVPEPRRR